MNSLYKKSIALVAVFCFMPFLSKPSFATSDLEKGIKELAQQISKNMTTGNKKKIAIIEFTDLNGNITAFGQFLAEELITELFIISPGQFEVVERRQLMKVIKEQKLTMTGLLDVDEMESIGKILGIDAIVTGSLADLGNNIKVNARLIAVDTAKIFAVASTNIPKVETVVKLIAKEVAPMQVFPYSVEQRKNQTSTRQIQKPNNKKFKGIKSNILLESFESLAKDAEGGTNSSTTAENWIDEYNMLIKEVKAVLKDDLFIQAIEELKFLNDSQASAGAVARATKGLNIYLTSFNAIEAFKEIAFLLAEKASTGTNSSTTAENWIDEYNRMLREAKIVLSNNSYMTIIEDLEFKNDSQAAAKTVSRMAKKLAMILESMENQRDIP